MEAMETGTQLDLQGLVSGGPSKWLLVAKRKSLGAASAVIILALILAAVLADSIAPYDPLTVAESERLQPPSWTHPMGTDNLGRDILSRIIHGSRISLWVGFLSVLIATGVGVIVGTVSAYAGGTTDLVVQRFIDAVQSIPGLILALVMAVVLGPSTTTAVVAIAIVNIPSQARVVRSAVLSVAEEAYIDAARAVGCSNPRIMQLHILPNIVAPVIVLASVLFGNAIIIEASLSFLGLGTPPPAPSWGGMLSGAGRQFMEQVPTLALFPGLAISIAVLAFNLFGDMLRDILDPKLRRGLE
jgi:ABC-type dipeptide/oligopeptide/nickel transport system permease subunit